MRKLKRLTLGALLAFLLVSCQSYKKVPYLQDTAFVNDTEQSIHQTGVKVMPKDLLTIAGLVLLRNWLHLSIWQIRVLLVERRERQWDKESSQLLYSNIW